MTTESLLHHYDCAPGTWDEMYAVEGIRSQYQKVFASLQQMGIPALQQKDRLASELFMNQGITFTVYSDNEGIERIFPFDIIPRILTSAEWKTIEQGIQQRLRALNLFLKDIYSDQQILKDGLVPEH